MKTKYFIFVSLWRRLTSVMAALTISCFFSFFLQKKKFPNEGEGSEDPLKPKPKPRAPRQELHYAELDLTQNPPKAPRRKQNDTPVEYAEVEFGKQCPV